MKSGAQIKTLEERLDAYDPDVAQVVRRVLFEEQRKLGLKNPKDIVTLIEKIIDESVVKDSEDGDE